MRMRADLALSAAALAMLAVSAAAVAQSGMPVIGQKDRAFSQEQLDLAPGTTVRFNNDDRVAHNVVVRDPDGSSRTSPLQKPGDHTDVAFAAAGDYDVRCALHPRMRMTVRAK